MQTELAKRPSPSRVTHKHKHTPGKEGSDLTNRMKRTDMRVCGRRRVLSSHRYDWAFYGNVIM
jgi:hypothetical protein